MKCPKFFFVLATLMAILAINTLSATSYEFQESFFSNSEEDNNINVTNETFDDDDDLPLMAAKSKEKTSLRGTSRFLAFRAVTTCDKNHKVCQSTAHAGRPDCCHKKCVDLKTDKLHCGKCGVKTHHSEICCNGHVVNPMSDKKHCGSCDNRCRAGGSCALGMCSYA